MELNDSKTDLLSSDRNDDSDERELSEGEDEDDDRNHKHRRREEHAQSLALEDGLPRTFRKRNRPFENGYSYRDGDPKSGVALKINDANPGRDFLSRHEKRRPNNTSFSKAPTDWNKRMRGNQMSGEAAPFWGRGRESVPWNVSDSRFGIFPGMGLPNVSNSPSIPWNGFGLFPGIQSGVMDAVRPLGLPGGLGPAITPPMNIRMPRQKCPDFEERGFCLRGDTCPMEHGLNRIVVEDVQSLSQFNLRAGSQLLGPSGQGVLPVTNGASDVYDPDQPLWSNDNPRPSAPFLDFNHSNVNRDPSKRRNFESVRGFADDRPLKVTSTNAELNSVGTSSAVPERGSKADALNTDLPLQGKWANAAGNGPPVTGSSLNNHGDSVRNIRDQSQKALRTLFVSGIPMKDNKREALLSHFRKFGEVISIHIPMQSERAFVQFSKREAAEAALKAPDAVMGNRFIKLFWANRDNVTDDIMSGSSSVPLAPHGVALARGPNRPLVLDKSEENRSAGARDGNVLASGDNPKPVVASGPSPLQQKKLENLETLKEELRKKQEMLEQKRSEFQRQLDKLQKQAVVPNAVALSGSPETLKVVTPASQVKPETAKLSPKDGINPTSTSPSGQKGRPHYSVTNTVASSQPPTQPLASTRTPIPANRFKLDNRPTSFKVISPLPSGIANVAALKEHFSGFGDLSSVELEEEIEPQQDHSNDASQSRVSARVYFSTRRSAEKAFLHGKTFEDQKMNFMWLTPGNARKESNAASVNPSVAPKKTQSSTAQQSGGESTSKESLNTIAIEGGEPENPAKESEAAASESIERHADS